MHDLPDFVYFNHAVHVQRGVGCVACHGRVDRMARVYRTQDLSMGFCLNCHRDASKLPEARVAPRAPERAAGGDVPTGGGLVVDDAATQPALFGTIQSAHGSELSLGPERLDSLTTCSACHR